MKAVTLMMGALLAATMAFGADFSKKSTDELLDMRGTMSTMEERQQLHQELQHRYKTMTQEQKRRFESRPADGRGMGRGMGGMGPGMGGGKGGR